MPIPNVTVMVTDTPLTPAHCHHPYVILSAGLAECNRCGERMGRQASLVKPEPENFFINVHTAPVKGDCWNVFRSVREGSAEAMAEAVKVAAETMRDQIMGLPVHLQPSPPVIVPLSVQVEVLRLECDEANQRANRLADECGTLSDENDRLHARISRLEREAEKRSRR